MSHLDELYHLKIPLDHILSATNNFAPHNFLGRGGFGFVYQGQLLHANQSSEPGIAVAVKRLDDKGRQGDHEFLTEIVMLARYKHPNLVSLLGFVDEGGEKLLVYNKEDNGSLDKHLDSADLLWEQRLKICLGAARALEYLHDGAGTGHRVLHCDVKSSNILLDANWNAKISDFGLSKIGPRNIAYTFLVTSACGTLGFVDPVFATTGVLAKESDVYSFGVVLFEVLCGRPAVSGKHEEEPKLLSKLVKNHHGKGKLDEIIFPGLVEQMEPVSLEIFYKIAFKCLNDDRKGRPTMKCVVEELESALQHQLGMRTTEPERKTGTRTKLWGSKTGGTPFLFQLKSNQKLRKITMYHNQWIHSLIFTVEDSNGLLHDSELYGDLLGHPAYSFFGHESLVKKFEINLDADEEIIGLSGSVGNYNGHELVTSLCYVTNKRKHGPFTHEADTRFSGSWDMGLFDGFYGRKGIFIDAIGCCLKATTLED